MIPVPKGGNSQGRLNIYVTNWSLFYLKLKPNVVYSIQIYIYIPPTLSDKNPWKHLWTPGVISEGWYHNHQPCKWHLTHKWLLWRITLAQVLDCQQVPAKSFQNTLLTEQVHTNWQRESFYRSAVHQHVTLSNVKVSEVKCFWTWIKVELSKRKSDGERSQNYTASTNRTTWDWSVKWLVSQYNTN